MSVDEEQEEQEEEEELRLEDFKPQLHRMIYNQPTVLLHMLETLFELLESRGVMRPGEAETLMREALRRWRDERGSD